MNEPLYIILYRMENDDRWEVYHSCEDIDEAIKHFETAVEDSGIDGEFRLIESEIIRTGDNR